MKTLLLLHGALGSDGQFSSLKNHLSSFYNVVTYNFYGHGGKEIRTEFSIDGFATDVKTWMLKENISRPIIFGYSMGGYVAIYLAKHYPEMIEKVITLATKFKWTPEIAAKEIKMLQPDIIEQKLPKFAEELRQRHQPEDWKKLLQFTADMMEKMGENNPLSYEEFTSITSPVLLMLGDRDKMVSLEETVDVFKLIPNAQLAVLPQTSHPIEQVAVDDIVFYIRKFAG